MKVRDYFVDRRIKQDNDAGYIDFHNHHLAPKQAFERVLGHPFATTQVANSYYQSDLSREEYFASEEFRVRWEPALLAYLNLKPNPDREELKVAINKRFQQDWFKLGLYQTQQDDDLPNALAFATAKLSFALQCCLILDWISRDTHAEVMQKNAIRAIDCFSSWREYGKAVSKGRHQYLLHGYSDYIGNRVTEEMIEAWLTEPRHPWNAVKWPHKNQ